MSSIASEVKNVPKCDILKKNQLNFFEILKRIKVC